MFAVHKIQNTSSWYPAGAEIDPRQRWYTFSKQKKARLANDLEYHLHSRKRNEAEVNELYPTFEQGSDMSDHLREAMTKEMHRRIGPGHEELKTLIVPEWSPSCRKLSPGDGYLEATVIWQCGARIRQHQEAYA